MTRFKKFLTILILSLVSLGRVGYAQCNVNASTCASGTSAPFPFVSPGPAVSTCLDFFGLTYGYIMIYITQSGSLNLLIDGNSSSGFLDVAIFNIPAGQNPCTAIQNTANQISCNYASSSSGCNQFGSAFSCPSSIPAPMVTAGQNIMIVVENWSGSSSNFTLQLGTTPGSAQAGVPNATINPIGPLCMNSAPVQMTAVNSGGTWSGPGISASGLFNPATAGAGTHTINYTIGVAPCMAVSSTTITVAPVTIASATPAVQSICSGSSTNIALSASLSGTTYSWTVLQNGVTGASAGTGNSITQTLNTTGSTPGTAIYTITPTFNGCQGTIIRDTVTVSPSVTPSFAGITPICSGATAPTLSTSSTNGITGIWSPAVVSNTATGTYTFTPTAGQCAVPVTTTVTVNPIPAVTITPATQTICSGAATNLALTSSVGGSQFGWTVAQTGATGAAAGNGTAITQSLTTTALAAGNVIYTIIPSANGCSGNAATATVTVNPVPAATATPTTQTICSATVTSVALTANVAGTTYAWTVAQSGVTGGTAASGTNIAQTLTNAGTTSASATYSVIPTAGGCPGATIPVTITVNPTPVVTATPVSQTLCSGGVTSVNLASATAGTTYSWTVSQSGITGATAGNGNTIAQTLTTTAPVTGTATYTVTPTANTCVGVTKTVIITVDAIPAAPGTITGADAPCAGSTQIYSVAAVSGAGSYIWTLPPGWTGSSAANTITVTVGTSNGTIKVKSSNNCGTSAESTKTVVTTPVLAAAISISNDAPALLCSGTIVNFTANTTAGGSQPIYQWKLNGNAIGNNSSIFSYAPQDGDTISCVLISNYPCLTSNNLTSNEIVMQVTETVNPSLNIYVEENHVCSDEEVTFLATPQHGGSAPVYQWKRNNLNVGTGGINYIYTPVDGDVITCIMASNAMCANPDTVLSNAVPMSIVPVTHPVITVTVSPGVNVPVGELLTFTANISGQGPSGYQVRWYRNNVYMPELTGLTWTAIAGTDIFHNNEIKAELHSFSSCADPEDTISNALRMSIGTLGIGDHNAPDGFIAYPNPTAGLITFDGLHHGARLVLRDIAGRDLQTQTINKDGTYKFDMSKLTSGVYIFSFESQKRRWQVRIFKK